jgi:uncharacterized protein (TIGR02246 family)
MKTLSLLVTLITLTAFTGPAMADDADDIRAATVAHFAALNAGDAEAFVQHHQPDNTEFPPDNGLLVESDSLESQKKILQAEFDAGLKTNLQLRHLKVKVYGNIAVVTGYVVGTVTLPGGESQQTTGRRSAVLIKQAGQWKEAHAHSSPLITPSPQ